MTSGDLCWYVRPILNHRSITLDARRFETSHYSKSLIEFNLQIKAGRFVQYATVLGRGDVLEHLNHTECISVLYCD